MLKLAACSLFLLLAFASLGQATLFTEDFEGPLSWTRIGDPTPNWWVASTCAGNGATNTGVTAMHISQGPANGSIPGCGPTGTSQYTYANAPAAATHSAIFHTTVDATCASGIQANFDYRIDGVAGEDYAELVYSTDGGTTWNAAGGELPISSGWTNTTVSLPAAVDASSFEFGFRFTYNDNTVTGNPPAIDNILITGTDNVAPVIICPTGKVLAVDSTCNAIMADFTKTEFLLSDNCTDSADIVVTQSIPIGTNLGIAPGGSTSFILTATDESGNQGQCTMTIGIIDVIAPVVSCPVDTSVFVDNNCQANVPDYTGEITASDNCTATSALVVTQSPVIGTTVTGAIVNTTIQLTATDEDGNASSCTFVMRTLDTIPTNITCPADTNLPVNTNCQAILGDYTSGAVLVDNCDPISSLTVSQSPAPGSTISANQVITLTVTGGTPAAPQTCTFNANLIDTITPTIICPGTSTQYVDNSCSYSLADFTGMAVVNENCLTGVNVTQSPAIGTTLSVGSSNVVLTVADSAGNQSQCTFNMTVVDTISPIANCSGDQSANGDINCVAILGDYTGLVIPTDNCSALIDLTVTQSPPPGTSITSTTLMTMTVTDEANNSSTCTFNVNIGDVSNPIVTCPGNQTVSTNSGCDYALADFTSMASATDNCSSTGSISFSQTPAPGTLLAVGTHTITIQGTDVAGNSGSCTFDVIVQDQVPPTFTSCPTLEQIIASANCEGTLGDYTGAASATDNCTAAGSITLSQSPAAGTVITSTTLVTITATDAAGNNATCQFNAVLNDTIDPVVTCPADMNIITDASCGYLVPDIAGSVTGTDNCSSLANMTVSQNPAFGSAASGITVVTITLTDEGGNSSTCTTTVTAIDNVAPTIACPNPAPVDLGSSCDYLLPDYGTLATVTDNCPDYTITQSPAVGTILNPGSNQIELTVTDAGGNTSSCTFSLSITENVPPTINCPNDTISCDPVVFYSLPTFSDNCFAYLVQTDGTGLTPGSTFPVGLTELEFAAIDSSGNQTTCSFRVEILEYPSPAVIADDTIRLCDQNSVVLSADPLVSGNGLWTLLSGQGVIGNQFANTTAVNNISADTSVFEWSVSSASCGTFRDTVVVIYSQSPLATSIPQDTVFACTDLIVDLIATDPLNGTGLWVTDGNAVITNPQSNTTTANLNSSGWHKFVWTVTSGSCPSVSDSVYFFSTDTIQATAEDTVLCLENAFTTITGSSLVEGQSSTWEYISGGGIISDPTAVSTNVSGLSNGVNTFVYEVTNPNCPTQTDTVKIVVSLCSDFDPVFPTVITPNLDGKNDVFEIDFLEEVYPNCRVIIFNRWGSVVYESVGYTQPWDGKHNGQQLPMGTYFYRIELNDSKGTIYTGDISIIH